MSTSVAGCLLTIAGTDPTSGAGVTADLQVFTDFGFHPLWLPTVLVDQDTDSVGACHIVYEPWLAGALERLDREMIRGIKIGLLHTPAALITVAKWLAAWPTDRPIVVLDPVFRSGLDRPLAENVLPDVLARELLPLVDLVTPNAPEAERLTGRSVEFREDLRGAAERLLDLGPGGVLVKGGHLANAPGDLLLEPGGRARWFPNHERFERDVHGTGCHLSSAICALLAHGLPLASAIDAAKRYLTQCVRRATCVLGAGRPVITHGHITVQIARAEINRARAT